MVVINTVLDKRKIKKDETYPISYRIYHLGKTRMISSKIQYKKSTTCGTEILQYSNLNVFL
jgi:hypothetical protein